MFQVSAVVAPNGTSVPKDCTRGSCAGGSAVALPAVENRLKFTVAAAPEPGPPKPTVGALVYPLPALVRVTLVTAPAGEFVA